MKVWITKYALTLGVFEAKAASISSDTMLVTGTKGVFAVYYQKPDWHTDQESARLQVLKMGEAELVSLHKQMAKVKEVMDKHQ
jgi:hypothetical protein